MHVEESLLFRRKSYWTSLGLAPKVPPIVGAISLKANSPNLGWFRSPSPCDQVVFQSRHGITGDANLPPKDAVWLFTPLACLQGVTQHHKVAMPSAHPLITLWTRQVVSHFQHGITGGAKLPTKDAVWQGRKCTVDTWRNLDMDFDLSRDLHEQSFRFRNKVAFSLKTGTSVMTKKKPNPSAPNAASMLPKKIREEQMESVLWKPKTCFCDSFQSC